MTQIEITEPAARHEKERALLQRLAERIPGIDAENAAVAARRVYARVAEERFMDAISFLAQEMGFSKMCTITGLDTGSEFEFLYHIANSDGILLTLKYRTGREDPCVIPSVLTIYQGVTFYERELEGLLGVRVQGLPEGRQYPLPDNWPKGQYPMRKDWKPQTSDATKQGEQA